MLYKLPANWSSFANEVLSALLVSIAAMAQGIDIDALGDDDMPAGIDQLEALADARDEVQAELTARNDKALADAERAAAVRARFAEAPAEESAPVVEEAAATEEPEVLAAEGEPAPVVEPEVLSSEAPAAPVPAPAPAAAEAARELSSRRTPAETPAPVTVLNGMVPMQATDLAPGFAVGQVLNLAEAAQAIAHQSHLLKSHHGERSFATVVHHDWQFPDAQMLSEGNTAHNYAVFQNVKNEYTEEQEALVASGGPCAPLQSTYNFFSIFSPQRPIEAFLPTVGAPRGGIKYLVPVALSEAAAAITTKDAAALALATDHMSYTDKNCSRVSCPSEDSVTVAAVSWCVTFDNLNFRVFPEQVQDFLRRVQTQHTKAKEVYYLNRIDAESVAAVTPTAPVYGATRSLHAELATQAHRYRKAHNMDRDAVLDVLLPDAAIEILQIDMSNDHSLGMSFLNAPAAQIITTLAQKLRLNVGFYYYDATTVGFPSSAHAGTSAAWRPLPTILRSYMWAPGSIVRLDAGVLDLGVVRDSALNRSNDVELFAEQFVEIAHVGAEIVRTDHTMNPTGVAPAGYGSFDPSLSV